MPYARSFEETALRARLATDGARIIENLIPSNNQDVWKRASPHLTGRRAMISLTDTASASLYGLQMARLSRAGDNADTRAFIAPSDESLAAGVASMTPVTEPQLREPNPKATAPGAYPLTAITYAATAPRALDPTARAEYASFLEYVSGPGQQQGQEPGQLPRGFTPLPTELREQTVEAARQLSSYSDPVNPPPPSVPVTASPAPATTPPVAAEPPPVAAVPAPLSTAPARRQSRSQNVPAPSNAETSAPTEDVEAPTELSVSQDETEVVVADQDGTEVVAASTPGVPTGPGRVAMPILGGVALGSALLALELTKRPRRIESPVAPGPAGQGT
jgi:hypothetical protein